MRSYLLSTCSGAWHVASATVCLFLEPSCRGKGFGTEAVLMMMSYGKEVARPWVRATACWE